MRPGQAEYTKGEIKRRTGIDPETSAGASSAVFPITKVNISIPGEILFFNEYRFFVLVSNRWTSKPKPKNFLITQVLKSLINQIIK